MVARSVNSGVPAGLFTGVQVGAAIFASQLIVGEIGVGLLGLLRYSIALLLLLPVLLIRRPPALAKQDILPVMLLGIGQIGLMITLLNLALSYTGAARVALIFATLPAFNLLINRVLSRTGEGALSSLGVVLTIGGVGVLVGHDALFAETTNQTYLGIAAAFGATLSVALCSTFYSPYVRRYGAIKISTIAFAVSLAPLAALSVSFPSSVPPSGWSQQTVWLLLLVGMISGVGHLTWFHAIKKLSPTKVTGFLALSPPTAAVLSGIWGNEVASPLLWPSVLTVSAGIICFAVANQRQARLERATPPGTD